MNLSARASSTNANRCIIWLAVIVYFAQAVVVSAFAADLSIATAPDHELGAGSVTAFSVNERCHDQDMGVSRSKISCCADELSCDSGKCSIQIPIPLAVIELIFTRFPEFVDFYLIQSISFFLPDLFRPPQY